MLEIKNLTGGYVHVPVLKDVSFTVEGGQLAFQKLFIPHD